MQSAQYSAHMQQLLQECSFPSFSSFHFYHLPKYTNDDLQGILSAVLYYMHLLKIQLIYFGCHQSKQLPSKCLFMQTEWSTLLIHQLVVFYYFGLVSGFESFFCSQQKVSEEANKINVLCGIKTVVKGIIEMTQSHFYGFSNACFSCLSTIYEVYRVSLESWDCLNNICQHIENNYDLS